MKTLLISLITAGSAALLPVSVRSQGADPPDKFVSQEEYQKLLKEHEQLKREMQEMRDFRQRLEAAPQTQSQVAPINAVAAPDEETIEKAKSVFPGTTRFLLTGYGDAGFVARRMEDDHFTANFNPILLWKLSDRLLFEGEIELELEDNDTSVKLELADLNYIVNDYVTFTAGKFLNPMNSFVERYHMSWINRLPDKPLAVYDGLLPETYLGAQFRGGVPVGSTKFNYSVFAGNGPELITDGDFEELGSFEFDNFENEGGHFSFGGHIGFLPIPEIEVGYGIQYARVASNTDSFFHSVDLNYVRNSNLLKGLIRVNAQWVWSDVDDLTYVDPLLGAFTFDNRREGGYGQITYRATQAHSTWLRNLEPVFRYDRLNQDRTPVGFNEERYTMGLNYWLNPTTVFKAAYQIDDKTNQEPDQNAILFQFAAGF